MTTTKQSWLKRSLAVLLAVMMVMSMGVANVFAAGTESSEKSVKEQLQELVDYADTLDPADYTPESWSPVNILLTGIKANINNEEMLSQYGEQWLSTLKQKIDELVPTAGQKPDEDVTNLENGIYRIPVKRLSQPNKL